VVVETGAGGLVVELGELRIPKAARSHAEGVIAVTDAACKDYLDAEYADLCRRLVGRLARKRPSPLARGDARIWAAGVVYALGQLNFLFDRSQTPHVSADRLSELLGVKKSTMANKAKLIRDSLGLNHFDTDFLRRELIDNGPFAWLLEVDGFIVDARDLPVALQIQAHERGLIPYVPAEGRR